MPSLPSLDELLDLPLPVLVAISIALLLALRFIRLHVLAGPPAGDGRAPSRSWKLPRLWRSKRERRAAATALVMADTELLNSRIQQAEAIGGLVQSKAQLEAILASVVATSARAPRQPAEPSLTGRELEQLISLVPDEELSPDARANLLALLAATLAEKSARYGEPS